jgi:hypothetical protein
MILSWEILFRDERRGIKIIYYFKTSIRKNLWVRKTFVYRLSKRLVVAQILSCAINLAIINRPTRLRSTLIAMAQFSRTAVSFR